MRKEYCKLAFRSVRVEMLRMAVSSPADTKLFPKQCLHLGVLAELRAGRISLAARASADTQNVEKTFSC